MNSYYAVRVDKAGNRIRCEPDERGYISAHAGDELMFADPRHPDRLTAVNGLVFFAKTSVKVQLGDNAMYPIYLDAGERRGVEKLRVRRMTVLQDSTFYYEAMTA